MKTGAGMGIKQSCPHTGTVLSSYTGLGQAYQARQMHTEGSGGSYGFWGFSGVLGIRDRTHDLKPKRPVLYLKPSHLPWLRVSG